MGFTSALRISASGLTAQRLRMDIVSGNIANAHTTRTSEGGPYKRKEVVFGPNLPGVSPFTMASQEDEPAGVRVVEIVELDGIRLVSDPKHPDADEDGFVAYPEIDLVEEMGQMMAAVRAYEASVTAMNAAKSMALKALEIGRG